MARGKQLTQVQVWSTAASAATAATRSAFTFLQNYTSFFSPCIFGFFFFVHLDALEQLAKSFRYRSKLNAWPLSAFWHFSCRFTVAKLGSCVGYIFYVRFWDLDWVFGIWESTYPAPRYRWLAAANIDRLAF